MFDFLDHTRLQRDPNLLERCMDLRARHTGPSGMSVGHMERTDGVTDSNDHDLAVHVVHRTATGAVDAYARLAPRPGRALANGLPANRDAVGRLAELELERVCIDTGDAASPIAQYRVRLTQLLKAIRSHAHGSGYTTVSGYGEWDILKALRGLDLPVAIGLDRFAHGERSLHSFTIPALETSTAPAKIRPARRPSETRRRAPDHDVIDDLENLFHLSRSHCAQTMEEIGTAG